MIISHEHRYVFVEVPRTGSSAISRELRERYGGVRVLTKHATYEEFARQASDEERRYFVFAGVRNPLDDMVSQYFKLKTHHRKAPGGREPSRGLYRRLQGSMSRYLERNDADFSTWFLRYKLLPYDSLASFSRKRFDHVIRFEQLSETFAAGLELIGLEASRPLPVHNPTSLRSSDFAGYYSPAAIRRARRVFGPYLRRWGYRFPLEWNLEPPSLLHEAEYIAVGLLRRAYWRIPLFGI